MTFKLLEFGRPRPHAAMMESHAGLSQLRAYWEGLRQDGTLPDRAQLDPRGLAGVLDRVFLAEAIGRGLVQVRIAGSALSEAAGMDLRGLPLSCLFAAEARPALAEALQPVIDGKVAVALDLGTHQTGRRAVARLILLPLTDGPDRRLVLGCLGYGEGALGRRPKFDILHRQEERLVVADPAVEEAPRPAQRRPPHLTLVHARD
jgi:hypothetical protein